MFFPGEGLAGTVIPRRGGGGAGEGLLLTLYCE